MVFDPEDIDENIEYEETDDDTDEYEELEEELEDAIFPEEED